MTTVYLIRHCQAEGNLYRIIQGHWDGDITELGFKQIEALKERMKDEKIDKVYSSDLFRAYITAYEGIAKPRGLEVAEDKRLREMNMGIWEGQFFGNIEYDEYEKSRIFMFDAEKWSCENAETFSQARNRIYEAVKKIAEDNNGKSVAICSHGEILRCFLSKVLDTDLSDVGTLPICKNTAVSKLTYENGKFEVVYKNDYSHLGDLRPGRWNATQALRDISIEPMNYPDFYMKCHREGWAFAHDGSLEGYSPNLYLSCAQDHYEYNSSAVKMLLSKETPVGIVDMDTSRGEDEGYGWLSFLYIVPEYRFKGYGIQALARAYSEYERLGRNALRLTVNRTNTPAIKFYLKHGFNVLSQDEKLLFMEKKLKRHTKTD